MAPDRLGGRYRILSPLGAGGMGEVFLAEDTRLERRVAVKLLPASAGDDAIARERLRREALAAAALDHPFICKVFEIGDADGRFFIVMEYVEGETLHASSRRALLPLRQVIDIAHELAQALDAAHRRGILHRDLKPANVMMTSQGHVKVLDFGLAKQVAAQAGAGGVGSCRRHRWRGLDRLRHAHRHAGVHVARTGARRLARRAFGSLLARRHPARAGDGPPSVSGRRSRRDDDRDSAGCAGVRLARRRRDPRPGRRHRPAAGQGVRRASPDDRRTAVGHRGAALSAPGPRRRTPPLRRRRAPAERTPFVGRDSEAAELLRLRRSHAHRSGRSGADRRRARRRQDAPGARADGQRHASAAACASPATATRWRARRRSCRLSKSPSRRVRLVPQAVRAAMGDLAPEIAAMVPSLRRTYTDIPPLPDVPADQRRRLMFGAFLEYVQRGTQKSPGVFLLDDLHWADEPTLQLLLHIAPHLASMRLLVVGTYRDVELDVGRPFAKTLESLLRQRLATRIALRRLNESGVQELLARMGGAAPPSELDESGVPRDRRQSVLRRRGLSASRRGRNAVRRERRVARRPSRRTRSKCPRACAS